MSDSLVYIVLINWNGKADTDECIKSLLKNDYSSYQIILVDNASDDDSVAYFASQYPMVHVIANTKNMGFSHACNQGIDISIQKKSAYTLFLNNDTVVDPHFLTAMVQALSNSPSAGAAGSKIFFFDDPDRIWFAGGMIDYKKGLIYHIGHGQFDTSDYSNSHAVSFLTGCSLLIKTEILQEIGGFDVRYFAYVEDVDLSFRISQAGYSLLYVPESRIWHKVSASTGGEESPFKDYMIAKNTIRFAKKNLHGLRQYIFILRFVLLHIIKIVHCALTLKYKTIGAELKGISAGLLLTP